MVEPQPSKLVAWVRFPSPAPKKDSQSAVFFYPIRRIGMSSRVSGYVIAAGVYYNYSRSVLRIDYIHFLAKMVTCRLRRITYKAPP